MDDALSFSDASQLLAHGLELPHGVGASTLQDLFGLILDDVSDDVNSIAPQAIFNSGGFTGGGRSAKVRDLILNNIEPGNMASLRSVDVALILDSEQFKSSLNTCDCYCAI